MNKKLKEFLIQHDFVLNDYWYKKQLKDNSVYLSVRFNEHIQNVTFRLETNSGYWFLMGNIYEIKQINKLKLLFDFKHYEDMLSTKELQKLRSSGNLEIVEYTSYPEIRWDGINITFWRPYKDTLLRILKGKYAN